MANPTTTTRSTPVGTPLGNGYSTKIAFAADPDVSFWEKSVKPPGYDGGDPVDTTTMHNSTYRTKVSQGLIDTTNSTIRVAYDPVVIDQIVALLNVEGGITVHYPNGDTKDFWGYLKSFEPDALEDGTQPEANIEIVPTNTDPSDNSEAGPNYKTSAGTD